MNLLIIGAGGHGKVVAEIAADCGYRKIDFLDDNSSDAIGKISDLEKLEGLGYQVPVLIHPTAYISRTAKIEKGTVVEPKAIVNVNTTIRTGCIISVGVIVDHDVIIEKCCHINAGAIVKAGATIEEYTQLEAGKVKLGYQQAIVKK